VDLFGVSNLRSLFRTTSAFIRSILTDEFGDLDKEAALLDEYSPLKDAGKISVPLFVYAGANDARVPKSESDAVVAAARANKVPVEYMLANNEGHSLDRRENRVAFLARVARFLGDRLKK
jgi:dipeptidyl aminopeptidase/acylaminoacyl peptidase